MDSPETLKTNNRCESEWSVHCGALISWDASWKGSFSVQVIEESLLHILLLGRTLQHVKIWEL